LPSEILLATRSRDKAAEIMEIIAGATRVQLVTLADIGLAPTAEEDELEVHPTFIGNALAKARHFAQHTGRITLADDSGLMVTALSGRPGVRTKRFAADHGIVSDNPDEANNELLLTQLADVPDGEREAQYVCAAAVAAPHGKTVTAIGTCSGRITREPAGTGGFGYDPLFLIPDLAVTFAQLSRAQKNQRSHRARAVRALAAHLK
jgi:XTP/dITP diphosphohydrolase